MSGNALYSIWRKGSEAAICRHAIAESITRQAFQKVFEVQNFHIFQPEKFSWNLY